MGRVVGAMAMMVMSEYDDEGDFDEEEEEEEGFYEGDDICDDVAAVATQKGKPGSGGLPPSGPGDPEGGNSAMSAAGRSSRSSAAGGKQGRERDKVALAGPIPVGQPEAARAWRNIVTSALGAATGRPEQTTQWLKDAFTLN